MQAVDKLTVKGSVEILIVSVATGWCVRRIELPENLIMTNFRTNETYLLEGNLLAQRNVNKMQFGLVAAAPAVTDVAINTPTDVAITSYDYPTTRSVRFTGTMAAGVGNGKAFVEAGLLLTNNSLAARRVFAVITKSAEFSWIIYWTLTWP